MGSDRFMEYEGGGREDAPRIQIPIVRDLPQCPFCRGESEMVKYGIVFYVACCGCGATGGIAAVKVSHGVTNEQEESMARARATALWTQRAEESNG